MNKFSKLLAGFAVIALAASCGEEPANTDNGDLNKPAGDIAYVKVYIGDVNSRATTDGGYVPSDNIDAEHTVNHLRFVFYDQDGNYVFDEASDELNFEEANKPLRPNVEYVGSNVIVVLEGLKGNSYPNYMLTVINNPSFKAEGKTLAQASQELNEAANIGDFVMSTSSYLEGNTFNAVSYKHDNFPYATMLTPNNFFTTLAEAQQEKNAVQIYVERLAAKVQVKVAPENETVTIGDKTYYKLPVSVAGAENLGDGVTELYEPIYLEANGWNLNATAAASYLSKQFESDWAFGGSDPFANWNKDTDYRSYWAKSTVYGTNLEDAKNSKLNYLDSGDAGTYKLGHTDAAGYVAYCYENTNDVANAYAVKPGVSGAKAVNTPNVTHVVLRTTIGTIKDNVFTSGNFITYRGILYKEEHFLKNLLTNLKNAGKLVYYVQTSSTTDEEGTKNEYALFGKPELLQIARDNADGTLKVQFKADAFNDVEFYTLADGTYTKLDATENAAAANALTAALAEAAEQGKFTRHTDGATIYYIPIEHEAKAADYENEVEGYFGVVRNHWYRLSIGKFTKVGHGLFAPEGGEEIIPEGPEDPLYYVGAKINILSWRIVKQNPEL